MHARRRSSDARTSTSQSATPDAMSCHATGSNTMADTMDTCELEFVDLVGVMDAMEPSQELRENRDTNGNTPMDITEHHGRGDASIVVALFCDGFVCRHWTSKSGWVEGFAQSYDATSSYFLECLEKESLPDGLQELLEHNDGKRELLAEVWDLRCHPTALCPLTSADLPREAPRHLDGASVQVRHLVLRTREQLVDTEPPTNTKQQQTQTQAERSSLHPASDQFPQLSNADLEALTNDELASLALGPETDLLQVEADLVLLDQVDEADSSFELTSANAVSPSIQNDCSQANMLMGDEPLYEYGHHFDQLTTVKTSENTEVGAPVSFITSPTPFISPSDTKARASRSQRKGSSHKGSFSSTDWLHEASTHEHVDEAEWTMSEPTMRSVLNYEHAHTTVKSEPVSVDPHATITKETTAKKPETRGLSIREIEESFLSGAAAMPIKLNLSPDNFDSSGELNTKPKKPKKKSKKHVKPAINSDVPLPATHLFLTRIHGKRSRHYTIDQIDSTSPPWMMARHMGSFFHAAYLFERRHAQFLQVNVERIMTANHMPAEPAKLAAGSMSYIAMQLKPMARPDQVIAAAHIKKPTEVPISPKGTRHFSPRPTNAKVLGLRSPTAVSASSPRDRRHCIRSPASPCSPQLPLSPVATYFSFKGSKASSRPPSSALRSPSNRTLDNN